MGRVGPGIAAPRGRGHGSAALPTSRPRAQRPPPLRPVALYTNSSPTHRRKCPAQKSKPTLPREKELNDEERAVEGSLHLRPPTGANCESVTPRGWEFCVFAHRQARSEQLDESRDSVTVTLELPALGKPIVI